jgi:hypothetical protein
MRRLQANGTAIAQARIGTYPPSVLMYGTPACYFSMSAPLAAQPRNRLTVATSAQRAAAVTPTGAPLSTLLWRERVDWLVLVNCIHDCATVTQAHLRFLGAA